MEGPGSKPGDEHDRHEIEHAIKKSSRAEFAHAVLPGAVFHHYLHDLEASRSREHRHEAVESAVDSDFVRDLSAVRFKSTVEVVKLEARESAHDAVEHLGWQGLPERIVAALFPSGDEVGPVVELREELGAAGRLPRPC